ncbi:MAG: hypothetical protein FJ271_12760 [Planctomycetes bacterium]|nr:hypothetical protein [Planctomycetota bacterium]
MLGVGAESPGVAVQRRFEANRLAKDNQRQAYLCALPTVSRSTARAKHTAATVATDHCHDPETAKGIEGIITEQLIAKGVAA